MWDHAANLSNEIKSLRSSSFMVKLITGKSKEYPEIHFDVDRNLICVNMMVQFMNARLLYPWNDADVAG